MSETENEFAWEAAPDKATRHSKTDWGFDRFPPPKTGDDGKVLYASKVYPHTYKAVANALAKYKAALTEAGGEGVELPEFQRVTIKDNDKKPIGVKVLRIK